MIQPKAVAQHLQTLCIAAASGLLKGFGRCMDQAVGQAMRQAADHRLCLNALRQRRQRFGFGLGPPLLRLSPVFTDGIDGPRARSQAIKLAHSCCTMCSACTAASCRWAILP